VDADGNLYQWQTNTNPGAGVGDHVSIRGRVRRHDLWQQRRVTHLTRASLTRVEFQPVPGQREGATMASPPQHEPPATEVDGPVTGGTGGPDAGPGGQVSQGRLPLAEVIDITNWLSEQSGRI